MRALRRPLVLILLPLLFALPLGAQESPAGNPEETDASTPAYRHALELQRKGRWATAKRAFERMLEEHPDSIHREDAENRSGDNAYLGTTPIHVSGPADRRIDVSVMGDGFTIDARDQKLEARWARLCLEVLWNEHVFDEYRNYFNVYFVRLASLEEGVDPNLSPEQRAKIEERNRRRLRKRKTDFDTALDCKAAGPQGQVMADRTLVYKWLRIAEGDVPGCGDDDQVIAFARFGRLGMGGGGIANVGRPDKAVTVHEFGHSFVGLGDEYAINPGPPRRNLRAPNVSMTDDPDEVPWAHFLKKRVKGVGIYEGGGTFKKGVWRPAASCAMNAGGKMHFCPVCREVAVLGIYGHVDPVDERIPAPAKVVSAPVKGDKILEVVPMMPRRHALKVSWFVQPIAVTRSGEGPSADETRDDAREPLPPWWRRPGFGFGGERGRRDRSAYDDPPAGAESRLGRVVKGRRGRANRHRFPLGRLDAGDYRVTAVVRDPTRWVLLDPKHLLEERVTWRVRVREAD